MKINFAVKIPLRERFNILFKGGLFIEFNYRGQHLQSDILVKVIDTLEVEHANNK